MIKVNLWVDGSYLAKIDPERTYSGVVIASTSDEVVSVRRIITKDPDFVSMWNVGGELVAAYMGLLDACSVLKGHEAEVNIHHDYKGIKEHYIGEWRTDKKAGNAKYVSAMKQILKANPNISIKFTKVKAHSGIPMNELADRVAAGEVPNEYKGFEKECLYVN